MVWTHENSAETSRYRVWINTYENTIFSGLFTSINPSYFDVNKKRGTIGFDTLPYEMIENKLQDFEGDPE